MLSTVTVSSRKCNRWTTRQQPCSHLKGNSNSYKAGLTNRRIIWSESRKRSRRNSRNVWKSSKNGSRQADQELESANSGQAQAKHEMAILVAERNWGKRQSCQSRISSGGSTSDKAAQQTTLSVFKSVLSMQNMGCHSVSEQLKQGTRLPNQAQRHTDSRAKWWCQTRSSLMG